MSDPLTSLVKKIDKTVHQSGGKYAGGKGLGTYVIVQDAAGRAEQLRDIAKREGVQHVSMAIGVAPPRYEVSSEAEITIVIYNPERRNQQSVVANFAFRKGQLDESRVDAVVQALSNVLPR
jgi:hypothetical protein